MKKATACGGFFFDRNSPERRLGSAFADAV
jgi:hypothetical protein